MTDRIYIGHVLDVLKTLPDKSVHCCVTSPPYLGLRDYGIPPQIWDDGWRGSLGLEPTIELYVKHMVDISREIKRVLRDDGTYWLNLGDSYASGKGTCYNPGGGDNSFPGILAKKDAEAYPLDRGNISTLKTQGLKPKDLMMMPARVALALQADGWWLRSDIIWVKPNVMPGSQNDRPTVAHEHIFLLSKSRRYFYDDEAVKEPTNGTAHDRGHGVNPKAKVPSNWDTLPGHHGAFHREGRAPKARKVGRNSREHVARDPAHLTSGSIKSKQNRSFSAAVRHVVTTRKMRDVWTMATKPFNMWQETSHLRRVEGDGVSGDTLRKPSPRCPVHAHRDFPCDACAGSRLIHNQRTFPRPVDMRDALLTEISRQSGESNPLSSTGCSALRYFLSATEHSNENRKMDHVLLTILPCISSGEIASRIGHKPEALEKIDSAVRIFESSILADSFSDEREIDLLAQTLFHSVGKSSSIPPDCLCHYYQKKQSESSHFATFPPAIPERAIKAGTSEKGCCPECGNPWVRVVEKGLTAHDGKTATKYEKGSSANRMSLLRQAARERGEEYSNESKTIGWKPTCEHGLEPVPCVVLDCFAGSGTVGEVARNLGRRFILIDLNEKYIDMQLRRVGDLLCQPETVRVPDDNEKRRLLQL